MPAADLIGQRFGRLTVIKRVDECVTHGKDAHWICRCDCGKTISTPTTHTLRQGKSTSCGCLRLERSLETHTTHGDGKHGKNKSRLYHIWADMKNRCSSPTSRAYKNYGARGITVCQLWQEYEPFRLWALSNGYDEHLTLDRIDVNGNYGPSNCRWATWTQQANNTRRTKKYTVDGLTLSITEWAQKYGIPRTTLTTRLSRGLSMEEALGIASASTAA